MAGLHDADARRVDEHAVAFAFFHHLGVAGYQPHAGLPGGLSQVGGNLPEGLHGSPSSRMKPVLR